MLRLSGQSYRGYVHEKPEKGKLLPADTTIQYELTVLARGGSVVIL